jgi:type I restriction enzyme S subunit
LPIRWTKVTLRDLIEIKHGFAFAGEHIRDVPPGDVLLTPGNFAIGGGFKADKFKYYDGTVPGEFILNADDLLVTMTDLSKTADTLGYPALVPLSVSRFLHNQRLGKVIIRDGAPVRKDFLYYLLRTKEYRNEVLASATGTTVKHTSPTSLTALPGICAMPCPTPHSSALPERPLKAMTAARRQCSATTSTFTTSSRL